MNYNTDKPIATVEQDLLGRASFSNQLGKGIYEYEGKESLVIGLFGKWGTGKTSVINMAMNQINILSENDNNKPIIMRFSPWNYSDKNDLISIFFKILKNKVISQGNEELKNKVGKALSDYSGAFDALSIVPVVGSGAAAILKTTAKAIGNDITEEADLDITRKQLEDALIKADNKIVIVIDDIDRLTNSQIRDIFQLVKQVADFPNIIYILAMDREVVRNALTEVHNVDGDEYLEKIIQIPFEIPELKKSKLNNIFFTKLDEVVNEIPTQIILDKNYWNNIFRNCIEPYINTLRDVNRLINIFQFKYGLLYQETSLEDMIGITTLEVLEPKLYKWIFYNKEAVCGGFTHEFKLNENNQIDYRQLYKDEFIKLGINSDQAIKSVSALFPTFAKDVKQYQYSYQPMTDIKSKMRIAYEERFDLYFMLDLDEIKVSRNIINACIHLFNERKLKSVIEEINSQNNIIYFLDELKSLIDEIPSKRLGLITSVLLSLLCGFKGEKINSIFTFSAGLMAEYLILDLLKLIDTEDERYKILHSTVENVNISGLGAIASIIIKLESLHDRKSVNLDNKDIQIINMKHLEELKKIYINKIHNMVYSSYVEIFNIYNFNDALYLWRNIDKQSLNNYIKGLIKNDINMLKYICTQASHWAGNFGSGWNFDPQQYEQYISQDKIYDVIQNMDKKELYQFTNTEQLKLASFILNYNNSEMDFATEDDAKILVDKWKNTEK